jgi:hypothetical protein
MRHIQTQVEDNHLLHREVCGTNADCRVTVKHAVDFFKESFLQHFGCVM